MKKPLMVGAAFVLACVAGILMEVFTKSATASYVVAVITMAAAVAALFGIDAVRRNSRIRSKIKAKDLNDTTVIGVHAKTSSDKDISSAIDVKHTHGGEITGVKED
jgi:hypothetical protein